MEFNDSFRTPATCRSMGWRTLLSVLALCLATGAVAKPKPKPKPRLEVVAEWNRLEYDLGDAAAEKAWNDAQGYRRAMLHGVKVDGHGTLYVSTARWGGADVPATLSRMVKKGGGWKLQPFPSKEMNDVSNPKGLKAVLGFEIDRKGVMWILDQGHIAGAPNAPGDAKLVAWDLKQNREVARYEFSDAEADRKCSFLNDVAVDNDAGVVYITDSGIFCDPLRGGLLVYDMKSRQARRVLSAPEWVNDEEFSFRIQGRDVLKAKDGKPNRMRTGADGIALSGDRKTLYWTNLTGNRLLRVPAAVLRDPANSEADIARQIEVVARLPSNTDGMTADRAGNLYMTALELNGLTRRDARTGRIETFVADEAISWPDTIGWGPGGNLYFVANHLHLFVDGDMDFDHPAVPNFRIYRVHAGGRPYLDH